MCSARPKVLPALDSAGKTDTADKVLAQWDVIKRGVEGRKADSILDEVSKGMPALERAAKLQKKAAKSGFDWATLDDVWPKVDEELAELREAVVDGDLSHIEDEIGDLLFAVVNISRHLKVRSGRRAHAYEREIHAAVSPCRKIDERSGHSDGQVAFKRNGCILGSGENDRTGKGCE